jgi:mycothiol S-conjugate amidase
VTRTLRLLAVHAHPDDESSKGAAATAKYVDEGVEVMVVSCTGGERGDVLNPAAQLAVDEHGITEVRKREMAAAAEILGVQHVWLGFEDSGYPEGDPKPPLPAGCFADLPLTEVTPALVRVIREFRPQVVTTYDENGGYPHPDHIRTHEITMAAVSAAADPQYFSGDLEVDELPIFQVQKVYYNHQFSKRRIEVMHNALIEAGIESPYGEWLASWDDRPENDLRITTRVPCADYFEVREAALTAHATQVDPDGLWFAMPLEMQKTTWPTEDFELAFTTVESNTPEDDLFAGLRD